MKWIFAILFFCNPDLILKAIHRLLSHLHLTSHLFVDLCYCFDLIFHLIILALFNFLNQSLFVNLGEQNHLKTVWVTLRKPIFSLNQVPINIRSIFGRILYTIFKRAQIKILSFYLINFICFRGFLSWWFQVNHWALISF